MKFSLATVLVFLVAISTTSAFPGPDPGSESPVPTLPLPRRHVEQLAERQPNPDFDFASVALEARYSEELGERDFDGHDLGTRYAEELGERDFDHGLEARYFEELEERDFDSGSQALETRYGEELEVRQAAALAKVGEKVAQKIVEEVVKVAIKAITGLIGDIKDEKKNRETFVKHLLAKLVEKDQSFNYMIIHTKHTAKWDGKEGVDWYHTHVECPTIRLLKKTIGYEVYSARSGDFVNNGDGGFINWAFQGKFTRDKGHVVFSKP